MVLSQIPGDDLPMTVRGEPLRAEEAIGRGRRPQSLGQPVPFLAQQGLVALLPVLELAESVSELGERLIRGSAALLARCIDVLIDLTGDEDHHFLFATGHSFASTRNIGFANR